MGLRAGHGEILAASAGMGDLILRGHDGVGAGMTDLARTGVAREVSARVAGLGLFALTRAGGDGTSG